MVYLTLAQTLNPLMVRGAHRIADETGRPFLSSTIVLNTEGLIIVSKFQKLFHIVIKLALSCVILIISNGFQKYILILIIS